MSFFKDSKTAETNKQYELRHMYDAMSPYDLREHLQEKHNKGAVTPEDIAYLKNRYPNPKDFANEIPEDSNAKIVGHGFARGAASLVDLPQLAAQGTQGLVNIAKRGLNKSRKLNKQPKLELSEFANFKPLSEHIYETAPAIFSEPQIRTDSTGKRFLKNLAEGAGSVVGGNAAGNIIKVTKAIPYKKLGDINLGSMTKDLKNKVGNLSIQDINQVLKNTYKSSKGLSRQMIGGGLMQHGIDTGIQHDINPIVTGIGVGLGGGLLKAGATNLRQKIKPKYQEAITKQNLQEVIENRAGGKENLADIYKRINKYAQNKHLSHFPDVDLTTVEIAQNPGLAKLARALENSGDNFQYSDKSKRYNNKQNLNKRLNELGVMDIPESSKGEAIRVPFVERHNELIEKRRIEKKPYYTALDNAQDVVNPADIKKFLLNKKSEHLLDPNEIYSHFLNPLEKINSVTPKQLDTGLRTAKKNATKAKFDQDSAKQTMYGNIAEQYEDALNKTSVANQHRKIYKDLSEPINALEDSNLMRNTILNRNVKRPYSKQEFVVSSEEIPAAILKADLTSLKHILSHANKDQKDIIKGIAIEELQKQTNPIKYLNNPIKKEKIGHIFDHHEQKVLDEYGDIIAKNNFAEHAARAPYSITQPNTEIASNFFSNLGKNSKKLLRKIVDHKTSGLTAILPETTSVKPNTLKDMMNSNLFSNIMTESPAFNQFMQNPVKTKSFKDFYHPVSTTNKAIVQGNQKQQQQRYKMTQEQITERLRQIREENRPSFFSASKPK